MTLHHARTTTLIAALVAIACALGAAPIAAFGDADERALANRAAVQEALEVRAEVEQVNEVAREDAPAAVGARCDRTLDVEGIGDTCVDRSGLLRVEQADGRSHTIHGLDAPPVGAAAFTPTSQAAISGADASDITCAGPGQPRYVLVYARPGNVGSRYGTIAPLLRDEIYKVSAFIDAESRSVNANAGRKLPLACEGGVPIVRDAALGSLSSGTAVFRDIVDALRGQGYEFNGDGTGLDRYVVYYDSPSPSGAAGTGHVFTSDSRPDAGNANNNGGLYAVEYRFADGGAVPHWEVLIHEVVHTMGAVVAAAPNSSGAGAGHCNDGQDVMCYADGGSTSNYRAGVCATKVLDCGRNDYFNPAPAAGSYLATHWNVASTANRFLVAGAPPAGDSSTGTRTPAGTTVGGGGTTVGGGARDTTRPSAPGRIAARQVGGSIRFAWRASSDNVGVVRYDVRRVYRGVRLVARARANRVTIRTRGMRPGSFQTFLVTARDAAGNVSAARRVRLRVVADRRRPTAPRVRTRALSRSSVVLSWTPSRDEAGIRRYEVSQRVGRRWVRLRTVGARGRSLRIVRLRSRSSYVFRVLAVDANGNRSGGRALRARTR